jgi:hypothetical protein
VLTFLATAAALVLWSGVLSVDYVVTRGPELAVALGLTLYWTISTTGGRSTPPTPSEAFAVIFAGGSARG